MTSEDYLTFEKELEHLINKYSRENISNTADFILAQYMNSCLHVFEDAVQQRDGLKVETLKDAIVNARGE